LSEEGILLDEPVTDRLDGAPIYLLLNRLDVLGLAWFVEDDIVHITTQLIAQERMSTKPYNVSDFFDAGYTPANLEGTLHQVTDGLWSDEDGSGGSMEWLGDVLFVRQTDQIHQQVAGVLTALRKHGRRTFTLDPPQHRVLRQKLNDNDNVSVKFRDTPLVRAVQELAEQAQADIRLDTSALKEEGVREREPVSLSLSDRKLSTVLHVLLAEFGLTWILRDGVLLITTELMAEEYLKTAVYDVRDLCQNQEESAELMAAIQAQTNGLWVANDGSGGAIVFPKSGTMAVRQTESVLGEIGELLAAYRKALLASKPRKRDEIDDQEVVTRYYRMHESVADGLTSILSQLVQPATWKSAQNPEAAGTVLKVASDPKLLNAYGQTVHSDAKAGKQTKTDALVVSQAVLIIRQTRAAHEEIAKVITRVEHGDPFGEAEGQGFGGIGGGLGGGGAGFGSGFFSVR